MTNQLLTALLGILALTPYGSNASETVSVKYFGLVNLDGYSCEWTSSSFVNRICYEKNDQTTIVLLKSTYYAHCSVPIAVYRDWLSASSKGRFYNSQIKGRYHC